MTQAPNPPGPQTPGVATGKQPPTPVAPGANRAEPGLASGMRVEVTQQVPRQNQAFHTRTQGVVVKIEQRKTGSWFAHAKDDKLWLDRLTVRKDDGEIVVFNLDALTHVEVLGKGD